MKMKKAQTKMESLSYSFMSDNHNFFPVTFYFLSINGSVGKRTPNPCNDSLDICLQQLILNLIHIPLLQSTNQRALTITWSHETRHDVPTAPTASTTSYKADPASSDATPDRWWRED